MIFYAHTISPRLRYVTGFIGSVLKSPDFFELTDDPSQYLNHQGPGINYSTGNLEPAELKFSPHSLLFESDIRLQSIECFDKDGYPAFFQTNDQFGFDIFAASFYLISRYEEYLPYQPDSYGRYGHENSLAYRYKFLNQPIVNIWIEQFRHMLEQKFPGSLNLPPRKFVFTPTYDIDQAYAYRTKSILINAGGILKSLMSGKWKPALERLKFCIGRQKDPYDAYDWMDQLHLRHHLRPAYFFILAEKEGKYDKNINATRREMQDLIKRQSRKYSLGIHPSWQSGDKPVLISKEKKMLESITGQNIIMSRQHFIRFTMPDTFRELIRAGISADYSMGYGSINGFRASVASPFFWYDLQEEQSTSLQLFPFCYMEANSFFEQKNSPAEALLEMKHYYQSVRKVNGMLITIWHNNFLGRSVNYPGWREVYEEFISGLPV